MGEGGVGTLRKKSDERKVTGSNSAEEADRDNAVKLGLRPRPRLRQRFVQCFQI